MGFRDGLDRIFALGGDQGSVVAPDDAQLGFGRAQAGGGFESLVGGIPNLGRLVGGPGGFQDVGARTRAALRDLFQSQTGFDPRTSIITLASGRKVRQLPDGSIRPIGDIEISTLRPGQAAQVGETTAEAKATTRRLGAATQSIIRQQAGPALTSQELQEAEQTFAQRRQQAGAFDPREPRGLQTLLAIAAAAEAGGGPGALLQAFQRAQAPTRAEQVAEDRAFRQRESKLDRDLRRELAEAERLERRGRLEQARVTDRRARVNRTAAGLLNDADRRQQSIAQAIAKLERDAASGAISDVVAANQSRALREQLTAARQLQATIRQRRTFELGQDREFDPIAFQRAPDESFFGGQAPPALPGIPTPPAPPTPLQARGTETRERFRRELGEATPTLSGRRLLAANPTQTQRQIEEKAIGTFLSDTRAKTARNLGLAARKVLAEGIDQPGLRNLNVEFQNLLQSLREDQPEAITAFGTVAAQTTEREARESLAAMLRRLSDQLNERRFRTIEATGARFEAPTEAQELTAEQFARQQEAQSPLAALLQQLTRPFRAGGRVD